MHCARSVRYGSEAARQREGTELPRPRGPAGQLAGQLAGQPGLREAEDRYALVYVKGKGTLLLLTEGLRGVVRGRGLQREGKGWKMTYGPG